MGKVIDLTSNTNDPGDEVSEVMTYANDVEDACQYIKVYSKDGVIINGFFSGPTYSD